MTKFGFVWDPKAFSNLLTAYYEIRWFLVRCTLLTILATKHYFQYYNHSKSVLPLLYLEFALNSNCGDKTFRYILGDFNFDNPGRCYHFVSIFQSSSVCHYQHSYLRQLFPCEDNSFLLECLIYMLLLFTSNFIHELFRKYQRQLFLANWLPKLLQFQKLQLETQNQV